MEPALAFGPVLLEQRILLRLEVVPFRSVSPVSELLLEILHRGILRIPAPPQSCPIQRSVSVDLYPPDLISLARVWGVSRKVNVAGGTR